MKKIIVSLIIIFLGVIFSITFLLWEEYYLIYMSNVETYRSSKLDILKTSKINKSYLEKEDKEIESNYKKVLFWNSFTWSLKKSKEKINLLNFRITSENNIKLLNQIKLDYVKVLSEESLTKKKELSEIYWKEIELKIPKINLDITTSYLTWTIDEKDFLNIVDEKLKEGPIRYSSNDIVNTWITYIFWHSSQVLARSIKNYSFFRKLPILNLWETFSFYYKKKEFKYKIINSSEYESKDITLLWEKYGKIYKDKKIVFLITCYPINTVKRRWVVIWVQE